MKLFRNLLLLAGLLLGGTQCGWAQYAAWSRLLPPAVRLPDSRLVADAAGNTYISGTYRGTLTLGTSVLPAPLGPANNSNAFLAKLDPAGMVQWAIPATGSEGKSVTSLTLDADGNVYILFRSDSTSGTSTFAFGGRTLTRIGTMLARVSPAGRVGALTLLATRATHNVQTLLVAPGAGGDCFVGLTAAATGQFGAFTFSAFGQGGSSLIMKVDSTGTISLVRRLQAGTPQNVGFFQISALNAGPDGDLYCAGFVDGAATLGTSPNVTINAGANRTRTYVARFSPAGVARWGVAGDNAGPLFANAPNAQLAVGPSGEVYVASNTSNAAYTFGGLAVGAGSHVLKISGAGVPQWARAAVTHTPANAEMGYARIAVDVSGNVYRLSILNVGAAIFGTQIITHPVPPVAGQTTRVTAIYAVSYDSTGAVRWARTASGIVGPALARTDFTHFSGGMGCDASGRVYFLAFVNTPTTGSGLRFDNEVLTFGSSVVRLDPAAALRGTVYADQNGNGTRDAGETTFPVPQVVTGSGGNVAYSSSAESGECNFYGLPGAQYSITLPNPPPHHTLSTPTVPTGTFPAVGQTTSGLDFGLAPIANQADVRATLTPYGAARPGFLTRYRLTLENVGTTTVASGTASVTLDARVAYVSSTPAAARSGQALTWTYAALPPFGRREFDVLFSLPVNTALGTVLNSSAAAPLPADVVPADNTAAAAQTVTGSFDPNDIQVNYSRLTPAQVAAGQPLDYTVRFQNMGTDTAFTVVIQDTLNFRKLNLGSLMFVAQSHNCQWSLSGPGLLTVRFLNIRLPHRGVDVIRSQGFVRFRVLPRTTLALGDVIPNHGHIFFDFNAPIRTNTATTAVLLPTATAAARPGLAWEVYPNPATTALTLTATLPVGGPVSLLLLDALGRPVRRQRLLAPAGPLRETLAVQGLVPGVYVLQVALPGGTVSRRVVVE